MNDINNNDKIDENLFKNEDKVNNLIEIDKNKENVNNCKINKNYELLKIKKLNE